MAKKQTKKSKTKKTKKKTSRPVKKKKIKVGPSGPKLILKTKKQVRSREVDSTIHRTKIRVIGIGGGGSTIVSEIVSRITKADFYVANTDNQALRKSARGTKRFQFGQNLTRGLGTGMNAELGEEAAQAEEEKIKKLLEGQDLCIFIVSLGGGTSSGASPVFAKISKNLGNVTYGIFTLPFEFEGEKKMEMALEALEKVKPNLNIYTVIPNERIFQVIDKDTPLKDALSAINNRLADNLEGLIEMIYLPGLINIDFADLRTVMAGRGRLTYLNTIEVEGPNKRELIKKLISSPLYPYSIKGSRGILYNITSGKNIQLSEVHQISNVISESINRKAKIIFGINQNPKYQDRTKITLLATGCAAKGFLVQPKKKEAEAKKPPKRAKRPKIEEASKETNRLIKPKVRKKTKAKSSASVKTKKSTPISSKKKVGKRPKKKKTLSLIKAKKQAIDDVSVKTKKPKPSLDVPKKTEAPEKTFLDVGQFGEVKGKVRKNALQVKREAEEAEKEILDQEKIWEIPAILRRKKE